MRRGFHIWGRPHHWGYQLGQKERFGGSEENPATSLWQAEQSETYTDGLCHSSVCHSLDWVSTDVHRGWVLVWRADLGRGLQLAMRRQPEGMGVSRSTTRNAHGGSPDHQSSEVPLLSDVQEAGPPLQSLSPCTEP